MLTEQDASKKLCPFMYASGKADECLVSRCMAWKWDRQTYESGEPLPIGAAPADQGWEAGEKVWCAGGEYGRGEMRQSWRRPLPKTGSCLLLKRGVGP